MLALIKPIAADRLLIVQEGKEKRDLFLPAPHARFRFARSPHDRHLSEAVSRREQNVDPPHDLGWRIAIRDQLYEAKPLFHAQSDGVIICHARSLTDLQTDGNHPSVTEH